MNNQKKFMTRSGNLKAPIANLHTRQSDSVRFSTYIIFSSLVSFAFSFAFWLLLLVFSFFSFFFKLKIYILIQIWLCGRVSDKKNFTRPINVFCLKNHLGSYLWKCTPFDRLTEFLTFRKKIRNCTTSCAQLSNVIFFCVSSRFWNILPGIYC